VGEVHDRSALSQTAKLEGNTGAVSLDKRLKLAALGGDGAGDAQETMRRDKTRERAERVVDLDFQRARPRLLDNRALSLARTPSSQHRLGLWTEPGIRDGAKWKYRVRRAAKLC